jgi:ADP-heptose:LPS heptosyltransferase
LINHQEIRRILVINLKYLGDLIVSTPAIKALRNSYPQSAICVMVREEYGSVLKGNVEIDEILPFNCGIRSLKGWKRLQEEIKWMRRLRERNFDAVISLHPGDRLALWAWLSGARYRVAPRKQSFGYLYNIKVDLEEGSKSFLEYYLDIVAAFDAKPITRKTEFLVSDTAEKWAEQLLRLEGMDSNHVVIGVHPGASEPSKAWCADNFAALADKLLANPRVKIIFFKGPKERAIIARISELMTNAFLVVDTSNSIERMAALMRRCRLCIVNDSGARHLAVAVHAPTLTFFPVDKLASWDFYSEEDDHYMLIGKSVSTAESGRYAQFLDSITVDDAFDKVSDILRL